MYNLNKEEIFISKEYLLEHLTDYEIFNAYINHPILPGKNILSPLRKEKTPSFGFFMGEHNELCFNEFKLGVKGDCIKFVQILYNLTYFEALSRIAIDFNLDCDDIILKKDVGKSKVFKRKENVLDREEFISKIKYGFKLGIKRRDWQIQDISFWNDFGIDIKTLNKYNVVPISYFFIDDQPIKADENAYVFIEYKDNIETYKIYQPFNEKYKWLNNHNNSIWQGWTQLPEYGENLIITKSLKDVMSITENTDFNAVALQSENVLPKEIILNELKQRFKNIFILYDNDFDKEENWGELFAKRLSEHSNLEYYLIPSKYKSKDFSDLVKNHGLNTARYVLDYIITLPF